MKNTLTRWARRARDVLHDDRGAEGLEKLLIITAIVLPLLVILLFFKDTLAEWLSDSFESVRDDSDVEGQQDPFN
ncbi:MAG: hypothetical protein CMJ18_28040 [Phycisphaeraceae bacterium]|nr:hypothetical protein [Phycisphaeraceae bacterium]